MKSAVSASFEFRFQTHLTDDLHVSDVKTGRRERDAFIPNSTKNDWEDGKSGFFF